ncbi:MAG: dynamin family protein [Deltaproteobacteria bacterium]|nr:dynamin family protein [Deltaproteobacteria bacterium]
MPRRRSRARRPDENLLEIRHPTPFLRDVNLVDTPGTNSLTKAHQRIVEDYIPNADLILFVTSTDRPLSESERQFLSLIRGRWKRSLVFVLNKVDLVKPAELAQIMEYIQLNAAQVVGEAPRIFPVSVRAAEQAPGGARSPEGRKASGLADIDAFVFDRLGNKDKVRLKLTGPIDVLEELLGEYAGELDREEEALRAETRGLEHVVANVRNRGQETLARHLKQLDRVDGLLERIRVKSYEFLDEAIRLPSLVKYKLSRKKVEDEFRRHVLGEEHLAEQMDEVLSETITELVRENQVLWNDAIAFVDEQIRERELQSRLVGKSTNVWVDRRREGRLALKTAVEKNLKEFNIDYEAAKVQESASVSFARFVQVEIVGGGVIALFTAALHDVSGIVFGVLLAGLGFVVIPMKRKDAKVNLSKRIDSLARALKDALRFELESAVARAVDDIPAHLDPYTSLCRADRERIAKELDPIKGLRARSRDLRLSLEG